MMNFNAKKGNAFLRSTSAMDSQTVVTLPMNKAAVSYFLKKCEALQYLATMMCNCYIDQSFNNVQKYPSKFIMIIINDVSSERPLLYG